VPVQASVLVMGHKHTRRGDPAVAAATTVAAAGGLVATGSDKGELAVYSVTRGDSGSSPQVRLAALCSCHLRANVRPRNNGGL
jgi:hypothetical protein